MGEIIDLEAIRRSEPQELSLSDLVEQAEALVMLQEAVLEKSRLSAIPANSDNRITMVANSLQHLRRHLGLIRRLIPHG